LRLLKKTQDGSAQFINKLKQKNYFAVQWKWNGEKNVITHNSSGFL